MARVTRGNAIENLLSQREMEVEIRNELLLRIPPKECAILSPTLELVRLKEHQVLHNTGETLGSGYFCNSGVLSILSTMPNGNVVEVALIGKEGFAGVPLVSGFHTSHTTTIVQVKGTAYRIDASQIGAMLRQCPAMERLLHRYSQLLTLQTIQTSACNRFCEVHERLARWLLMTHDRCNSNTFLMTQDFLSYILGTRRSSITLAARILRDKKVIAYTRGEVTILDRKGLEAVACDCYLILREQIDEWQGEPE